MDMIAVSEHLPVPGETVGNARFMQAFGGKGANQAVAAARLGGRVTLVASLGNDPSGHLMREHFAAEGIDTSRLVTDPGHPTGTALILVDRAGENSISVAPGANAALLPETIGPLEEVLAGSDMLVMQAEIPYRTVREAALTARQAGIPVLLNPAPACAIDPELMAAVDILVVNRTEAEAVSGLSADTYPPERIARELRRAGARSVVITLGSRGSYLLGEREERHVPAFRVKAVDTTAAGDVFCGALAVACPGAAVTAEALRFASAASAISVTRPGAQPSIPTRREVEAFLAATPEP